MSKGKKQHPRIRLPLPAELRDLVSYAVVIHYTEGAFLEFTYEGDLGPDQVLEKIRQHLNQTTQAEANREN